MISVSLCGGLGNQMFQYAFALAYAKKNGVIVKITALDLKVDSLRNCQLDVFNANDIFVDKEKINNNGIFLQKYIYIVKNKVKSCVPKSIYEFFKKLKNCLRKDSQESLHIDNPNEIVEKAEFCLNFDQNLLEHRGKASFRGYFQCEKYFIDIRDEVLKAFSLKLFLNEQNQKMLEKIKSTEAVSLHVRRGDYVNLQHIHGLCTLNYYSNAIEYISKNVRSPHFFLFSDDIEWVYENLKIDHPHTIVNINSSEKGYFDLELMKNCKHNIIANSSFSWWGAWLNVNPYKIIVAPSPWFPTADRPKQDIIPENWIKFNSGFS